MKIIVVHDRYSNEPIVIKTSAIVAVKRVIDESQKNKEEYSEIFAGVNVFMVKETIGTILTKIKKAESED